MFVRMSGPTIQWKAWYTEDNKDVEEACGSLRPQVISYTTQIGM